MANKNCLKCFRLLYGICKTEYIEYEYGGRGQEIDRTRRAMTISTDIDEVNPKSFKYLGSFEQRDGGFVVDVKHRIKCGWMKRREA